MSRPKTVSDLDVMGHALGILADKGMGFTLTDVANRVGLSRATLIQRFGDREAILRRMAEHEVEATRAWLDGLKVDQGKVALTAFLELIVGCMGAGEGFSARVAIAALEAQDPVLRAFADLRYALVQNAIEARLPESRERRALAEHLHAVIAGSTMQWVASDRSAGLSEFVLLRLYRALDWVPDHLTA